MENTSMLKKLAVAVLMLAALPSQAARVKYYHLDALGSVRVVTDQAGAEVERHDYLPFGEECTTGPCATNPGLGGGEPKKFTGKERDSETGLDYFGARYYGAKIGRFTTIDPVYTWRENLLDPQRWNRYAYVRNNPLRYTDPDGRVIDTIADVGFIGYDLFDIGRSVYRGEGVNLTQGLALGGDIIGAVVPFATGLGPGIRAARAARAVDKTVDTARAVDKTADLSKAAGSFSKEKQALVEMAKKDKRKGITEADLEAYKELNKTLPDPFPTTKVRGPEAHSSGVPSSQAPHAHVGPVDHIPVKKN